MEKNDQNNQRFLTLLSLGKTMSTIGWVIVVIAISLVLLSLSKCIGGDSLEGSIMFLSGFLSAAIGYILVAQGEVISCFVSIENNTYKISKLMADLVEKISGKENS